MSFQKNNMVNRLEKVDFNLRRKLGEISLKNHHFYFCLKNKKKYRQKFVHAAFSGKGPYIAQS
jgi:hypothetical protein